MYAAQIALTSHIHKIKKRAEEPSVRSQIAPEQRRQSATSQRSTAQNGTEMLCLLARTRLYCSSPGSRKFNSEINVTYWSALYRAVRGVCVCE
jgi:hypothetical protein